MDETWILLKGSSGPRGYGSIDGRNAMGLLYFNQQVLEDREVQGTYIYPDWVTCVKVFTLNILILLGLGFMFYIFRGRGKITFCKEDTTAILQILQIKLL